MNTYQLIQDTRFDSRVIYERLRQELSKAHSEVRIAITWFTDNELFVTVQEYLERHVKVSIITL
ncbi:hypothetical protein [Sphingobacterium siyangense]|uniref:hypothetical protein n=1 Tax=Sphingobacterium siyangense TaxID=459529 RepID=UPI002FD9E670